MLGSFMLFLSNGFYIYVLTNFKFQITDIQFGGSYNVEYSQTNMPTGDEISAFEDKVQIRFKSDGNPSTVGLGFSIEWTSEELILTTAPGCKYQTFHLHLLISCDTSLHPQLSNMGTPFMLRFYYILMHLQRVTSIPLTRKP